jgi:hypothetical protein
MRFLRKIKEPHIRKRIVYERLTEPLHLNALSIFVALFGSYRLRVAFDLVLRHHNAFAILKAADYAKALGLRRLKIVEFGVAGGVGLINMCFIARRVSDLTGVTIEVIGFDTGQGMPLATGFRDHPDLYGQGDFPMDVEALRNKLPANGELIIGDVASTVPEFVASRLQPDCPIGYVAIDVDYYSSTVPALRLFGGDPQCYLPITLIYLDDIELDPHNPFAGELLAVTEFNERNPFRKFCRPDFLENQRLFRAAVWIKHIFYLHVMDHPVRSNVVEASNTRVMRNPYLA